MTGSRLTRRWRLRDELENARYRLAVAERNARRAAARPQSPEEAVVRARTEVDRLTAEVDNLN
jgi:hypothetical protein